MRKTLYIAMTTLVFTMTAPAQQSVRIGYVDMDYILANVQEYQEASAQLEQKAQKWKSEIELERKRIEALRKELDNERPLLTQELVEDREEEIRYEEQQLLRYQENRFGPNGDLMRQKLQLVKPVQDQVFIAVQEIAEGRAYDFIFDKSSEVVMLYAEERFDISDQVLRSITRASRREQLNNRTDREELIREEAKSVGESEEVSKREAAKETRQKEREALMEERRRQRDSVREARQKAFEERREKILQERQRKKDSIENARENQQEI